MPDLVSVNNVDLAVLIYKETRVITLEMMDVVHERPAGTAKRTFAANKHRLQEGKHFYRVDSTEKNVLRTFGIEVPNRGLTLLTESGYLKLVKTFRDDLAWDVQDRLVESYFRGQQRVTDSLLADYPELRAIQELVTTTALARNEAKVAQQLAQAAEVRAAKAEAKADLALADAHHMTVKEFICKNGLLSQFPPPRHKGIGTWLGNFCQQYGLPVRKDPVAGENWTEENSYPIQAFMVWLRAEQTKPKQLTIVK